MNKQSKENIDKLQQKVSACTDELSLLLDQIYKHPQVLRQKFYDRIQLLKQNLTQLKICLKDTPTPTSLAQLQKKYQQILMKLTELKNDITSAQFLGISGISASGKKKITGQAISNLQSVSVELHRRGDRGGIGKRGYDEIMETIVKKQQEVEKFKNQNEDLRRRVENYEQKERNTLRQFQDLAKQMKEIKTTYMSLESRNSTLQHQLRNISQKNQTLQTSLNSYKQKYQLSNFQILKLTTLLQQASTNCKIYKSQAQSNCVQVTALEQKQKYQLKDLYQKVQQYRIKEKNSEKCIREMEKEIEILGAAAGRNKQLLLENLRLKEDVTILEAELKIKQEHLYDKNRKIEASKNQLSNFRVLSEDRLKQLEAKELQIRQLLHVQKQNQNIITLLQTKISQLQQSLAQFQQSNFHSQTKHQQKQSTLQTTLTRLQTNLQQTLDKLTTKQQQFRKLTLQYNQTQQTSTLLNQQKRSFEKQCDGLQLQLSKSQKKVEELGKVIRKLEGEKEELRDGLVKLEKGLVHRAEEEKKDKKEIQGLKKRLLRAKIEAIHNIREVIV